MNSYILQHRGKPIDDSLPFRLAGLANNACLDLVESEAKKTVQEVEIALQAPDGRKIAKFMSTATLMEMLMKFSEEFGRNLVQAPQGEAATVSYLNKQVSISLFEVHHYIFFCFSGKVMVS